MARNDQKVETHHYVPRMLLKNFGHKGKSKQEKVHVFDKHNEKSFFTGVGNIVAENGFYDIEFEDSKGSLEPVLSELESHAGVAFKKLLVSEQLSSLSNADISWVAMFVACQHLRVKNFREMYKDMNVGFADKIRGMGYDPKEVEGFDEIKNPVDLQNLTINFLAKSMRKYSEHLFDKVWLLLKTSNHEPFLIGDNPVVMHNDNDFGPYGNIGLALRGIQIYMPISPTLILGIWCPSIKGELHKNFDEAKKEIQNLKKAKTLGANPNYQEINSLLNKYNGIYSDLKTTLKGIETNSPISITSENLLFYNSLQVIWANQFVISHNNDFSLVKRMLNDSPKYKKGVRMTM